MEINNPQVQAELLKQFDRYQQALINNDVAVSTTDGGEQRAPSSNTSEDGSRRSRYSPTSSVLEMSPRPSEETLRTRPSRDTRDGC